LGQLVPQSIEPPQPSPMTPQYWTEVGPVQVPFAQFAGAHK
jgi:hypothetical protein